MFTVSVETHFWALHQLTMQDGSKELLHGHNWSVTADVGSENLNSMGFVIDFHRLKEIIDETTSGFENKVLGENDYFRRNGGSAEAVAGYIYEKVKAKLPQGVKLNCIRVVEEPGCSAKFGE